MPPDQRAYAVAGTAAANEILVAEGLASGDRLMSLYGGTDSEQPSDLDADLEFLVRAAA
jgi:hypothetical protein